MRPHWQFPLIGLAVLGLSWTPTPAEPAAEGYTPVSPAPAVHAALQANLKEVQTWLAGRDFVSAARDAQGLTALAHLYGFQGSDRAWRDRTAALADACSRLGAAAGSKDAAACERLARECTGILDDLARRSPGSRTVAADFKPHGSTRTWMMLLDSTFTDAKWAKDRNELELLARTVAEEANAVQYLRATARWRQSSRDVRAAALEVAEKARANDLTGARAALKTVSRHCEACHDQTSRR
jgi:hypothetical protein